MIAVEDVIDSQLSILTTEHINNEDHIIGRIGRPLVRFDTERHVGSFVIGTDRLGLGSQGNFSSIHANVCVYSGNSIRKTHCC